MTTLGISSIWQITDYCEVDPDKRKRFYACVYRGDEDDPCFTTRWLDSKRAALADAHAWVKERKEKK